VNRIAPDDLYEGIEPSGNRNVAGWGSRSPVFRDLVESVRPQVVIEVGSWLGASAIHMATVCRELGLATKVYCVDTWLGAEEFWGRFHYTPDRNLLLRNGYPQVYYSFLSNVVEFGLEDVIVPVPNTSLIGAKILSQLGVSANLIYIDASHDYLDVKLDIEAYRRLLAPAGVMFGDDFHNDHFPGVARAVREHVGDDFEVRGGFWISKGLSP
jgi:hypothetical protein